MRLVSIVLSTLLTAASASANRIEPALAERHRPSAVSIGDAGASGPASLSPFLNLEMGAGNAAFQENQRDLPQVAQIVGADVSVTATRAPGQFTVSGDIASLPDNLQQQAREILGAEAAGGVDVTVQLKAGQLNVVEAKANPLATPDVMLVRAPAPPMEPQPRRTTVKGLGDARAHINSAWQKHRDEAGAIIKDPDNVGNKMKDAAYKLLNADPADSGLAKAGAEEAFMNTAKLLNDHDVAPIVLYSILSSEKHTATQKAEILKELVSLGNTVTTVGPRKEVVQINISGPEIGLAAANLLSSKGATKDDLVAIFKADPKNGGENVLRLRTAMTLLEEDGTASVVLPGLKDAALRVAAVQPQNLTKFLAAVELLRGPGVDSGDMRKALAPVVARIDKNSNAATIGDVMRRLNGAGAAVGNGDTDLAISILQRR